MLVTVSKEAQSPDPALCFSQMADQVNEIILRKQGLMVFD